MFSTLPTNFVLKDAIEKFALRHQVTQDIIFALLFQYLYERIQSRGMSNKMFLEQPIDGRPSACALTQGSRPDLCRLTFMDGWFPDHEPLENFYVDQQRTASFKSMLAVFVVENESGPLDQSEESAEARYRLAHRRLFAGSDATGQMLSPHPITAAGAIFIEALPHWKKFFVTKFPSAEFPMAYLISFLSSTHADAVLQRIKHQRPLVYAPNNQSPAHIVGDFKSEPINDYGASRLLNFYYMQQSLNNLFGRYALAIDKSDFILASRYSPVFIYALYKMFLNVDISGAVAFSNEIDRRYEYHTHHFYICVNTDTKTTKSLLERINQETPDSAFAYECKHLCKFSTESTPHVFGLSYNFVLRNLLSEGKLEEFLSRNPEFIKSMQEQYAALIQPGDPYYETYHTQASRLAATPS